MEQSRRRAAGETAESWLARLGGGAAYLAVGLGLVACSGSGAVGETKQSEQGGAVTVSAAETAQPDILSRELGSRAVVSAIGGELDTLLLAVALAEEKLVPNRMASIASRYQQISDLAEAASAAQQMLEAAGDGGSDSAESLERLSRISAQLPVQIKRLKQALRTAGLDRSQAPEVFQHLDTVKVAARSLAAAVLEAQSQSMTSPLARLSLGEQQAIVALNGPLSPSSAWYVLDEGHIDAIDVAFEDDELGISIHDETVDPDVERDPATTILVVKSSAKVQVPDARFGFLGNVGSDVWILPEGQPEAEAAGVLWAGLATEEIEAGVLLDDSVDVRFRNLVGPNGLSLFESPQDEFTSPVVLMDSEDGLPDTVSSPVGIHRHMNWAFESPGVYLLRIQARARLAALPGNPWVSSSNAILKFVVLP